MEDQNQGGCFTSFRGDDVEMLNNSDPEYLPWVLMLVAKTTEQHGNPDADSHAFIVGTFISEDLAENLGLSMSLAIKSGVFGDDMRDEFLGLSVLTKTEIKERVNIGRKIKDRMASRAKRDAKAILDDLKSR